MRFVLFLPLTILFACDANTTKPSGSNQTGLDATDKQCDQLKKDLEESIDKTIAELKKQGMDSSMIPSRNELKKQFEAPLKANGCSGY